MLTNGLSKVRKTQSWYGSWPRQPKATASTSIARENIFGDNIKSQGTSDLARFDSRASDEASSIRSKATSAQIQDNSSLTTTTAPFHEAEDTLGRKQPDSIKTQQDPDISVSATEPETPSKPYDKLISETTGLSTSLGTPERQRTSSAWLGWITRTPFTETPIIVQAAEETPTEEIRAGPSEEEQEPVLSADNNIAEQPQGGQPLRPSSWFRFWTTNAPTPEDMKEDGKKDAKVNEDQGSKPNGDRVMENAPPAPEVEQPPKAGSTWAFWSRDPSKGEKRTSQNEEGQIAVIGQGSESHPLPMTEDGVSSEPAVDESKPKLVKSTWRRSKRARPASVDDTPSPSASGMSTPKPGADKIADPDGAESGKAENNESATKTQISEQESPSKGTPNLLLPSFNSTYQMKENPSILQQISQLLLRTAQPQVNHVFRLQNPPKIQKAIAIGVHGLLPATYLRPMIGQPTGTSLRFANLGADAIRRWADSHGCSNCEIEKVALEGEGRISDRVDNLWKLLLNWIDHIRKADLIVMACHSQGVPVSIMLLEKLIELGVITNAKIGVCAMAGVALGPFPDYKSSFLIGSAVELWDFGNPQSQNSQKFETALQIVLDYGARITFVGSIDDQVVPMEVSCSSAICCRLQLTITLIVRCILTSIASIHLSSCFHRRARTCPRFHFPPGRVCAEASKSWRIGSWPHPRAFTRSGRLFILWRRPLSFIL